MGATGHRAETRSVAGGDPRHAQVVARDRSADGRFWYSVATTGVYCRPSCPSRTANPRNVAFHDTIAAARAAGFRPCRRCRPDDASADDARVALVTRACRLIDDAARPPSLACLARALQLSPGHLHRVFKGATGLTPRGYAAARRDARLRAHLADAGTVTAALYDAGFGSSGRFYARSTRMLGMTPSRVRAGGAGEAIRFAIGDSSLGAILVASSVTGVVAILLGDDPDALVRDLQDRFARATLIGADPDYERVVARVVAFVEAPRLGLDLPLDMRGTAFQQRVWQALQEVGCGRTVSYADLAARLGAPEAARAVAGACAANPIALAIPCHRVVRRDGALSGYAWGVERKRAILAREKASCG